MAPFSRGCAADGCLRTTNNLQERQFICLDTIVLAAKQADRYQRLLRALRVKFTSVRDIRKGRQAGGAADQ